MLEIVYLAKTLAAVLILRLNFNSTECAVVDDERVGFHGVYLLRKCTRGLIQNQETDRLRVIAGFLIFSSFSRIGNRFLTSAPDRRTFRLSNYGTDSENIERYSRNPHEAR